MDAIWVNLPDELVNKVCNKLCEVRRISNALKIQIMMYHEYNTLKTKFEECSDNNIANDLNTRMNVLWHCINVDKKWSIFYEQ